MSDVHANRRAAERARSDMAAIKVREDRVRAAIQRGEPEIDAGPFGMSQLGLLPVVADKWGRLWIYDGTKLVLVGAELGEPRLLGEYDVTGAAVARNGDG